MGKKPSKTVCHGIRKEPNGTFTIDCVKTIAGRRIHIFASGYKTLEEAQIDQPRVIEKRIHPRGSARILGSSLASFLKEYEEYRLLHVRNSTVSFGRSAIRSFFLYDQNAPVSAAFQYDYMRDVYQKILLREGTPEWKNRVFGIFRHMAETAFKWRCLSADAYQDVVSIFENIPENRGAKKERPIWTKKERERFLDVIDDDEDRLIFELFIALGCRIGEFAGLTWDCFDSRKGTIEIKQQLVYQNKGKWVLTPLLKTRESYRICRLPNRVVEMLKEYGREHPKVGFLFLSKERESYPLSKATIRRKLLQYCDKAGVKRITPHCIRHGKATDLMRVCKDMQEVKAAARFLGHSATIMVDTYGHSSDSATNAVLKRLERTEANVAP